MKRLLFAALATFCGNLCSRGQTGFIVHMDLVQEGRGGIACSVREVDGGYLVFSGQFSAEFPTKPHIYLRNLNSMGLFQEEHEYLVGLDMGFDLGYIDAIATDDEGTFVAIIDEGRDFSSKKMFYRFTGAGDTLARHLVMSYPIADSITQGIRQIRKVSGGYAFCGFSDKPQEVTKGMLGRMNQAGDTLWTQRYGSSNEALVALGVAEDNSNGLLLTGYGTPPGNQNASFLIRTDADGDQLWRRNYGGRAAVNGAVRVTADGGIITWSEYRDGGWPTDWQQMMLTRWDASGSVVWQQRSHYNYFTNTYDFEVLPDGSMIATGTSLLDGVLAKFSAQGDSLWSRSYAFVQGGSYLFDVEPTSDGGFVATGTAFVTSLDTGYQTEQLIWVLKTDSLGCVVPGCQNVGVREYEIGLQEQLELSPNPASARLALHLPLPPGFALAGNAQVVLLDAQGRAVLERSVAASGGAINDALDVSALPRGLYYLHLRDKQRWLAGGKVVLE